MNYSSIPLDRNAIEELLRESVITRIVTLVNLSSQSILELLEYGMSRQDINMALSRGVIAFDKSPNMATSPEDEKGGDYYIRFLSNKVKLTELGIYILETIEQSDVLLISKDGPSLVLDQAMDVRSLPDN
jgi:hypothetical protein